LTMMKVRPYSSNASDMAAAAAAAQKRRERRSGEHELPRAEIQRSQHEHEHGDEEQLRKSGAVAARALIKWSASVAGSTPRQLQIGRECAAAATSAASWKWLHACLVV
jgi:hypothetical protein